MARALRIEFSGAYYHVLSRGNEKRDIYSDQDDYNYFLNLLGYFCKKFNVVIHSYCLMSNHFHLLLETKEANLSTFMRRLLCSYAVRYNAKYNRVGHLFQGRYKAILVEAGNYLLMLSRYIHLNPCKANLVSSPENYNWSSMQYFINDQEKDFLEKRKILSSFSSKTSYHKFVLEGLSKNDEEIFTKAVGGVILGSKEYIAKIRLVESDFSGDISRKIELSRIGVTS